MMRLPSSLGRLSSCMLYSAMIVEIMKLYMYRLRKFIPKLGMRIPILRVSVPRLGTSIPSAKIWVIPNTSNLFN